MKANYEAATEYPNGAYRVHGASGVACRVLGWEVQPDEDTVWTGIEERTGRLVVVMVGDDHRWSVGPDDVSPIDDLEYCAECGQLGCTADGRERE